MVVLAFGIVIEAIASAAVFFLGGWAYVATGEAEALRQLAARLRRPRWLIGRRKQHIVDDDATQPRFAFQHQHSSVNAALENNAPDGRPTRDLSDDVALRMGGGKK